MKTPENLELVLRLVLLPTERVEVDLVLLLLCISALSSSNQARFSVSSLVCSSLTLAKSSLTIGCLGFNSMVFCDIIMPMDCFSLKAWARMMRSMFAELPYWLVTMIVGVVSTLLLIETLTTASPYNSFR